MKKTVIIIALISAMILPMLVGCADKDKPTQTTAGSVDPTSPDTSEGDTVEYVVKYAEDSAKIAELLVKKLSDKIGAEIKSYSVATDEGKKSYEKEILLNADEAYKDLIKIYNAGKNTYVISSDEKDGVKKILIYYSDQVAGYIAVDRFVAERVSTDNKLTNLAVGEKIEDSAAKDDDYKHYEELICYLVGGDVTDIDLIKPLIIRRKAGGQSTLRDPCILYDNGKYYVIFNNGTGWSISSTSSLRGSWSKPKPVVNISKISQQYNINAFGSNYTWAPELHKYDGNYYIFATYFCCDESHDSPYDDPYAGLGHRASIVLKSSDPMGPYELVSKNADGEYGHSTPANWDTIDATLYVDPNGDPWMIFVHEWTSMPGNIGDFSAVKLSKDLSTALTEPVTLFKAGTVIGGRDTNGVTDGCWTYTTKDGQLLCLWSTFIDGKYVVACARSESGNVLGPWTQDDDLLYEIGMYNTYDGGHPCILTRDDGQMYLVFHSPNAASAGVTELPTLIPIIEKDNKLVWGVKAK